jgi:hypothetical protein
MNLSGPKKGEATAMDCKTFENIVHDLDRQGTVGAAQCDSALAHAESCHTCAALLMQVEWLDFSLLQMAEVAAGGQASPRIEAVILQEFRRNKSETSRRQLRWRLGVLGTAAALFLAFGLSLWHLGLPRPAPVSDAAVQSQMLTPALDSALHAAVAHPTHARRLPAPGHGNAAYGRREVANTSSFLRLPYADDSAAHDGGAIVRVELPQAALASFGLPIADTGDAQRILADLIVSADGTPEAIRLVSRTNPSHEF